MLAKYGIYLTEPIFPVGHRENKQINPTVFTFLIIQFSTVAQRAKLKSFKYKGLRRYYETGSTRGIQAKHANRLSMQLAVLDTALEIADLDIPGYGLHQLKGDRKGIWTISVSGNWRLTFGFSDENAYLLDYKDYH